MSKVMVTEGKLVRIADTLRECLNTSETFTLNEMPDAIEDVAGTGSHSLRSGFYISTKISAQRIVGVPTFIDE